jgi:hypothetical protein
MTGNLNIDVADLFVKDTTGGAQGQVQIGAGTVQGFINIQKGDGTRTVQLNSDGTSYLTGGNVGIGTDSPPNLLTVDTNAAATTSDSISVRNRGISATGHTVGLRFQYNAAVPSAIRTVNTDISSGAGRLGLFTSPDGTAGNLVERLSILSNGFVGIGNAGTNPGNPLHVNHNGAPSGIVAKYQSNGNPWVQQTGASSSWQTGATSKGWELYNDNTNAYRIAVQTDGDVGIGTRDPTAKLEVANAAGGATVFINTTQAWTAANLSEFSNTPLVINSRASGAQLRFSGATDYVSIQSLTSDLSTAKNISLNPFGGNVGIGTNDPNTVLQAVGMLGLNRGANVPTTGILHDTSSTGNRTPIAIRTGASTSVPWSIIEKGSNYDVDGPYGVLNLSRLNHSDGVTSNIEGGTFYEFKNPSGAIREYAGVTGVRFGNTLNGGLHFYTSTTSGGERLLKAQLRSDGDFIIGSSNTNLGTKLIIEDGTYDSVSSGGHIGLKTTDNNAFHHMIRVDSGKAINYDAYGTAGWRTASTIHTNQAVTTFNDQIRAAGGISHWTDSGTKFYTHLCTLSTYQAAGAIIINTNIPGHNQSGNANMFSFRVTGFWYQSTNGGAIDITVGCYSGEGNYYNNTLTGTYPEAWKGKTWFATNSNGKVCLILGDTTTNQQCEIAVTDFVQGFQNVNTSYATDWSAELVTSYSVTQQSTIYPRNPGGMQIIDGTARTAIFSSSGSFTVSQSNTFTPIGTLSDFKIDIHVNVGVSDDEGGGNMNPYANGVIQRRINSGTWTTADNTGISNQGGVSCHVEMSPPRVGTTANTDTFMTQQDRYRTKNHSSTFIDRPSLTMGDTLQYRLICNLTNGNHIQIGEPVGYASDDNYMAQPFGFIITEFTPWG